MSIYCQIVSAFKPYHILNCDDHRRSQVFSSPLHYLSLMRSKDQPSPSENSEIQSHLEHARCKAVLQLQDFRLLVANQ